MPQYPRTPNYTHYAINSRQAWPLEQSRTAVAVLDINRTIQAARRGDEGAFTYLVNYYRGAAERVAQHILRTEEAAADAVQESLIKVHRAMPRFQDGNFRSWLLRIVTNTCYDHLRKEKRRAAVSLDELSENSDGELTIVSTVERADPESSMLRDEEMDILLNAIDRLPDWHRTVVLMIDVHGYDYAETAEALELPLGTIKSRLSRARSSLRDELIAGGVVPRHFKSAL